MYSSFCIFKGILGRIYHLETHLCLFLMVLVIIVGRRPHCNCVQWHDSFCQTWARAPLWSSKLSI